MARTASSKHFQRTQVVVTTNGGQPTPGATYDIGPSTEDGQFYVWERTGQAAKLMGGPFSLLRDAVSWSNGLVVPPDGRTPDF